MDNIQYGDINHDGEIDVTDLLLLKLSIIMEESDSIKGLDFLASDIDKNGRIDVVDLARLKWMIIE